MSTLRCARGVFSTTSRALAQRSLASSSRSAVFASVRSVGVCTRNAAWTVAGVRQFSMSRSVRGEGASDVSLAQKLAEELQYEREAATQPGPPEFVKEFQSQGVWTVQDNPGADEITFERTFGNETIRLMFSIADLDANPETEFDAENGNENEGEAESEGEGEEGSPAQDGVTSTPIRVAISITKRGTPGAVSIDAVCQDGAFLIENASYYQDAEVATQLTAEADWKRRGLYLGPTFENLDPAVQDEFERYLDERGINESLGLFIPDYAEYKEQTEYVRWLESVKKFVEA